MPEIQHRPTLVLLRVPSPNKIPTYSSEVIPFQQLRSAEELIELHRTSFVSFCEQHMSNNWARPSEWTVSDFRRSLFRRADDQILTGVFDTFQKHRIAHRDEPNRRMVVLEVGASSTIPKSPNFCGSPWVARWLASKFSGLMVLVSDLDIPGEVKWNHKIVEEQFRIPNCLNINYAHFPPLPAGIKWDYVFGRKLNEGPTTNELLGLKKSLYRHLSPHGQATIEFDGLSVKKFNLVTSPVFPDGTVFQLRKEEGAEIQVLAAEELESPARFECPVSTEALRSVYTTRRPAMEGTFPANPFNLKPLAVKK